MAPVPVTALSLFVLAEVPSDLVVALSLVFVSAVVSLVVAVSLIIICDVSLSKYTILGSLPGPLL